jgi:YVTN family beta-propeller protein
LSWRGVRSASDYESSSRRDPTLAPEVRVIPTKGAGGPLECFGRQDKPASGASDRRDSSEPPTEYRANSTAARGIARGSLTLAALALAAACSSPTNEPAPATTTTNATPPAPTPVPTEVPAGPKLYVSNETAGTVSVVDVGTRRVVATIAVGKRPRGIRASADGTRVYVALSGSAIAGPGVDESTLPPPDRRADGIGVIDTTTRTLVATLQSGPDPEQFAISKDGTRLFVANEDAGVASVVNIAGGTVEKRITVGMEPEGVDLSPDGRHVYVTSENDGSVFVIDTERLEVVREERVGLRPRSTAFLPDGSRAWVSAENEPAVVEMDARRHRVLSRVVFAPETLKPMGVALSPDGARVYVTTGRGKTLEVVDAKSRQRVGGVAVGDRPWGLVLSPDGRFAFTANGPSNDVSVVDLATLTVVTRVAVGERPWGLAYVP